MYHPCIVEQDPANRSSKYDDLAYAEYNRKQLPTKNNYDLSNVDPCSTATYFGVNKQQRDKGSHSDPSVILVTRLWEAALKKLGRIQI